MAEQSRTGTQHPLRFALVALPRAAADAREAARLVLRGTPFAARLDDALLALSELVTNAVLHGRQPLSLSVDLGRDVVRFSVHDGSPLSPTFSMLDPTAVTGRGLMLVANVTDAWGIEPEGSGKAVWFELVHGSEPSEDLDVDELLASWGEDLADPAQEVVKVVLTELDVTLTAQSEAHVEALLRELAIVSGSDECSAELRLVAERVLLAAAGMEELRGEVKQQLARAVLEGCDRLDVVLRVTRVDAETVRSFARAVDEADRLSRTGVLLTEPAPHVLSDARARYLRRLIGQLSD